MVLFESWDIVSYSRSIITMALQCFVLILAKRKSQFFHTHLHSTSTPRLAGPHRNTVTVINAGSRVTCFDVIQSKCRALYTIWTPLTDYYRTGLIMLTGLFLVHFLINFLFRSKMASCQFQILVHVEFIISLLHERDRDGHTAGQTDGRTDGHRTTAYAQHRAAKTSWCVSLSLFGTTTFNFGRINKQSITINCKLQLTSAFEVQVAKFLSQKCSINNGAASFRQTHQMPHTTFIGGTILGCNFCRPRPP